MAAKNSKINNAAKSTGKKVLTAVLSVVAALIVLLTGFILLKDSYFCSVAQNKVLDNDFRGAVKWASKSQDSKAAFLIEYSELRRAINEKYPELLASFDYNLIVAWSDSAEHLLEVSGQYPDLDSAIGESLASLSSTLKNIESVISEYQLLRPSVYSLMDLFAEYGRLYTKDAQGLNVVFTLSDETRKLDEWDSLNETVALFAQSFEEGGEVYLLNYLIQEARGESSLLRTAFAESGYANDESVRLEGENTRTVSTVQNGSESISLLEKERYEGFMYAEICKALVENLGEYFVY